MLGQQPLVGVPRRRGEREQPGEMVQDPAEALLGDACHDLRGEADRTPARVGHDQPSGLAHGLDDKGLVERVERPDVDDLQLDLLVGEERGCSHRLDGHVRCGRDRDVTPFPQEVKRYEELLREQRSLPSLDPATFERLRQEYGWEILGPSPF